MRRALLSAAGGFAVGAAIIWALFGFANWSLNPGTWGFDSRAAAAFWMLFVGGVGGMMGFAASKGDSL